MFCNVETNSTATNTVQRNGVMKIPIDEIIITTSKKIKTNNIDNFEYTRTKHSNRNFYEKNVL